MFEKRKSLSYKYEYALDVMENNEDVIQLLMNFMGSGKHLFDYVSDYQFPRDVPFEEKVTIYCQMISIFEEELDVSENFCRQDQIEYAVVYPGNQKNIIL
jgi:hypothetical protein